jgi:hypothetical protein
MTRADCLDRMFAFWQGALRYEVDLGPRPGGPERGAGSTSTSTPPSGAMKWNAWSSGERGAIRGSTLRVRTRSCWKIRTTTSSAWFRFRKRLQPAEELQEKEMPNGSHGDHPVSDILDYHRRVFSEEIDALVRQIAEYVPRERLWDLFDWFSPPASAEFEFQLRSKLAELEADASARGWEPKS